MYKTIGFEIALCTHTKDKAQRKGGEHRREEVKTKHLCFSFGCVFSLAWVKRFEVLCLFAFLPPYVSAGICYNHHDHDDTGERQ